MKKSEKFEGINALKEAGLPMVPFTVLEEKIFEKQIKDFLKKTRSKKFIIRTGSTKSSNLIGTPGLVDAELERDKEKIQKWFADGYLIMAMAYQNIYRNSHNFNVMRLDKKIVVEVVGRGFVSRDLCFDGHLHEEIVFEPITFDILKRKVISPARYQKSREKKMRQFGIGELKKNKSFLLSDEEYIPLDEQKIKFIKDSYPRLSRAAKKMGYNNFVASFGYMERVGKEHEPIFWDIYRVR